MRRSISDTAVVLARTDYGEKDRILTVITADNGKLKAIAKSVRSGKSRLAGGIELFAENELGLVEGRGDLYTVTHSRMKRYFGNIAKDLDKSMYAYECLKMVNKFTPDGAGSEYYDVLVKLLDALAAGKVSFAQVKVWFGLKALDNLGASPNFQTDPAGKKLEAQGRFQYDFDRHCFYTDAEGPYSPDHVKILRHLSTAAKPVEIKQPDENLIESSERLVSLLLAEHIN